MGPILIKTNSKFLLISVMSCCQGTIVHRISMYQLKKPHVIFTPTTMQKTQKLRHVRIFSGLSPGVYSGFVLAFLKVVSWDTNLHSEIVPGSQPINRSRMVLNPGDMATHGGDLALHSDGMLG